MDLTEEIWFGYPFWYDETVFSDNDELIRYCLLRKSYDDGNIKSNHGGWQSKEIQFENNFIIKSFSQYVQNYLNVLGEKFKKNIQLDNMWININGFGTSNSLHIHPGASHASYFSGVYYVKSDREQGRICFESPNIWNDRFVFSPLGNFFDYYPRNVYFKPNTGKIIIFPASIPHFVEENPTNIDRISIAFNSHITFIENE